MTCVVAIAHGNKIYMGADTYASSEYHGANINNPKIFINGEFIIGSTGSFRAIDLLHYRLEVPKVHEDEHSDPDRFIRTTFIEAVRDCFSEYGHMGTDEFAMDSGQNFVVGYRGNIYEIQEDFSVLNNPEWGTAVGSGWNAARGSLYTTKDLIMDPQERVSVALNAAAECVPSVRGPFVYLEKEWS